MDGAPDRLPEETKRNGDRVLPPTPASKGNPPASPVPSHWHSLWFVSVMEEPEDTGEPQPWTEEPWIQGAPRVPSSPGAPSPRTATKNAFQVTPTAMVGATQAQETGQLTITNCSQDRNKLSHRNGLFVREHWRVQLWKQPPKINQCWNSHSAHLMTQATCSQTSVMWG